jgi:hypothetical protein
VAAWLLHAWEQLALAAWPYAALAAAVAWVALAAAARLEASAKAYNVEQRVNQLRAAMLPAAIEPGTGNLETWHDFPAGINGWGLGTGGYKKYRLLAEGDVEVAIFLALIGTKTDGTVIFAAGALPSGYQPVTGKNLPAVTNGNALSANWTPTLQFRSDGSVAVQGVNAASLTSVSCHGTIPVSSGV